MDRYLAYLSGIGYFGINNNIITDKYGSYIFIAYVVNNYEFEPDKPSEISCLKCNKCVKYSPGNAILGNFEIDPRKCLSYITQKKEELSESEIQLNDSSILSEKADFTINFSTLDKSNTSIGKLKFAASGKELNAKTTNVALNHSFTLPNKTKITFNISKLTVKKW